MNNLPERIWLTAPAPDEIEWTSEKRDDADILYLRADTVVPGGRMIEYNPEETGRPPNASVLASLPPGKWLVNVTNEHNGSVERYRSDTLPSREDIENAMGCIYLEGDVMGAFIMGEDQAIDRIMAILSRIKGETK